MILRFGFVALIAIVGPVIHAAEGPADSTTRICFGRRHPECFLLEERDSNGKKEYVLASTKRGRVAEERTLTLPERDELLRAIRIFQSVAGPENQVCSTTVRFEQFKVEELIETQGFCARRSQSEALRIKMKPGLSLD